MKTITNECLDIGDYPLYPNSNGYKMSFIETELKTLVEIYNPFIVTNTKCKFLDADQFIINERANHSLKKTNPFLEIDLNSNVNSHDFKENSLFVLQKLYFKIIEENTNNSILLNTSPTKTHLKTENKRNNNWVSIILQLLGVLFIGYIFFKILK